MSKQDFLNELRAALGSRVNSQVVADNVRYYENYSPTLRAGRSGLKTIEYDDTDPNSFRVRKLTPRECFRLMGVSDEDIDKIQATGLSNSQQYRMAGNSIVVNVLEAIFRNLFEEEIL